MEGEAVYLVSDGMPTCGKIVDRDAIVAAATRLNRIQRVTLNTIGIQTQMTPPTQWSLKELAEQKRFLKELAEQNWGEHREVAN